VIKEKSDTVKVGEKVFSRVVNYRKYCSWRKMCKKGVLY